MREFEELRAWQKARVLCREIHTVTDSGRFARNRPLRDQMSRASVSVMSNIAEGFQRFGHAEFARFLVIARSSAAEIRCQLYAALDLGYIDEATHQRLKARCIEVDHLIARLRASLFRPGNQNPVHSPQHPGQHP